MGDLSKEDDTKRVLDETIKQHGQLNILVKTDFFFPSSSSAEGSSLPVGTSQLIFHAKNNNNKKRAQKLKWTVSVMFSSPAVAWHCSERLVGSEQNRHNK